jgi:single-strand DNA-binding protein
MFNATFIGNLGADPEVRFTQKGGELAQVRVAVNSRVRDVDGEWSDHTDWIRVRGMGGIANVLKRAAKGDRIAVIGQLQIGEYRGNDGVTRTSLDVWADQVELLSPKPRSESSNGAGAPVPLRAGGTSASSAEDLPF